MSKFHRSKGLVRIPVLPLITIVSILSMVASCASKPKEPSVRQQDLNAWVGVSVEALDSHDFFMKIPMYRTKTDGGTEVRIYAYGFNLGECFGEAGATKVGDFVNVDEFFACSRSLVVCNHMFFIRNGKVLEYAPTGRCMTNDTVQPDPGFLEN